MAIQHIAVIGGEKFVYLDAPEQHLSSDEARRVGAELMRLADLAEEVAGLIRRAEDKS